MNDMSSYQNMENVNEIELIPIPVQEETPQLELETVPDVQYPKEGEHKFTLDEEEV